MKNVVRLIAESTQGAVGATRPRIVPLPNESDRQVWADFATDISSIMGNAFEDLRNDGFRGMLSGMLLDFSEMLNQMAIKWASAEIFKLVTGKDIGGEQGQSGGGWLSKLLGIGIKAAGSAFGGGLKSFDGITSSMSASVNSASSAFSRGISFRAAGGVVTAGMPYIVGEREAELFVPNANGRIFNQSQINSGSNDNRTYNINIVVPNQNGGNAFNKQSEHQIRKAVIDGISESERRR